MKKQQPRLKAVLSATHAHEIYERDVWRARSRDPWEYEDHEPRLACLELDAHRMVRDLPRLACVDPVLEEIEEGTYGFSDVSGCPIPKERTETVLDAIWTSDEEQASEPDGERRRIQ